MPAVPPPSLLITPDLRRRLQQRYDEALRLGAQPRPDFRHIHELLAECVRADPGNILYLNALLANLRRRKETGERDGWWRRMTNRMWQRGGRETYSARGTPYSALGDGARLLWDRPADRDLLRTLAEAAGECDFDEVELRYLAAARDVAPDDVQTLRLAARALTRQGRFEDAVGPWFAVLALAPSDREAERAIEDLRGAAESSEPARADQKDNAQSLIDRARAMQSAGQFSGAEELFSQAQAALGGDLRLLEERENFRLKRSADRLEMARRRAVTDAHPKAQSLVRRMEDEHLRLEIEVLNTRAERLTADWSLRVELARKLKRAGNFSGAIQRLDESQRLAPQEPTVLVELGECWQHLRQFAKALDYYQRAATSGEQAGGETALLARYRAAVLAAAMGQAEEARQQLAAVIAIAPDFKDARERLDKLASN